MKKEKVLQAELVIAAGLLVLYFIFRLEAFVVAAAVFSIIALTIPAAGRTIVRYWFLLAELLGKINGYILLTLIFYFVLVPVALLNRLFSKDPLRLKKREGSYYHERNHTYVPEDLKNPW